MAARIQLTLDAPAFTGVPLHQRTVDNWSRAVSCLDDLKARIANELLKFGLNDVRGLTIHAQNTALLQFILETIHEVDIDATWIHFRFVNDWKEARIFETPLADMHITSLAEVQQRWQFLPGIQLMMLLGTYRTLVQRKAGEIPGFGGNISIQGAAFTTLFLGVPMQE